MLLFSAGRTGQKKEKQQQFHYLSSLEEKRGGKGWGRTKEVQQEMDKSMKGLGRPFATDQVSVLIHRQLLPGVLLP